MTAEDKEKLVEEVEADEHDDVDEGKSEDEQPESTAAGKKKARRHRKKSKAVEALNNVISGGKKQLPQALVDHVVDAVNAQGGVVRDDDEIPAASTSTAVAGTKKPVTEEEVRKALEILKAVDVMQGKTGLGGKNQKEMGEHKVRSPM